MQLRVIIVLQTGVCCTSLHIESTRVVGQGYPLERMMRWVGLGVGVGLGGTESNGWQRSCLQTGHSSACLLVGLHQSRGENMWDRLEVRRAKRGN